MVGRRSSWLLRINNVVGVCSRSTLLSTVNICSEYMFGLSPSKNDDAPPSSTRLEFEPMTSRSLTVHFMSLIHCQRYVIIADCELLLLTVDSSIVLEQTFTRLTVIPYYLLLYLANQDNSTTEWMCHVTAWHLYNRC